MKLVPTMTPFPTGAPLTVNTDPLFAGLRDSVFHMFRMLPIWGIPKYVFVVPLLLLVAYTIWFFYTRFFAE